MLVEPGADVIQAPSKSSLPWIAATFLLTAVVASLAVWNLKPSETRSVVRFYHELAERHRFARSRNLVALSPDGSLLAYDEAGPGGGVAAGLYLRSMDGLGATLISGTEGNPNTPFFSPDRQWLGFYLNGQLKKIPVGGGAPVSLCDVTNPFGASWGADDTIVFGQPEGIMRVSANGGTPELIVPIQENERIYGPRMLPGGEWVLFSSTTDSGDSPWDEAQIVVESLESGDRKVLLERGSDAHYVSTGHLVYAFEDGLFVVRFDVANLEVSGTPVEVVEGVRRGTRGTANFSLFDDASLAYVPGGVSLPLRALGLVHRDGSKERLDVTPRLYGSPRLSPDGTQIVVQTREQERGQGKLWVYDLSGARRMQLLAQQGNNERPIWTPDGDRITFTSDREGTPSIYLQRAEGSEVAKRLTTAQEGRHFAESWTPDGGTLSFSHQVSGSDLDLYTLSRESGAEPQVVSAEPGVIEAHSSLLSGRKLDCVLF